MGRPIKTAAKILLSRVIKGTRVCVIKHIFERKMRDFLYSIENVSVLCFCEDCIGYFVTFRKIEAE